METYAEAMATARREYLRRVLEYSNGKAYLAALIAGVNRTHFYKLLAQYGVLPPLEDRRAEWRAQRGGSPA